MIGTSDFYVLRPSWIVQLWKILNGQPGWWFRWKTQTFQLSYVRWPDFNMGMGQNCHLVLYKITIIDPYFVGHWITSSIAIRGCLQNWNAKKRHGVSSCFLNKFIFVLLCCQLFFWHLRRSPFCHIQSYSVYLQFLGPFDWEFLLLHAKLFQPRTNIPQCSTWPMVVWRRASETGWWKMVGMPSHLNGNRFDAKKSGWITGEMYQFRGL